MKLRELITDAGSNTLSHTKVWANIGYAAATVAFVKLAWSGSGNVDIWWAYLGCVAGASTASKFLSLRYGRSERDERRD
ncbi:MAG: hypothetical protein LBE62_12935 [Azonexus sp.]|jgi:hypothetical protein|nr:hypothetical protein [Azonexus sp.]